MNTWIFKSLLLDNEVLTASIGFIFFSFFSNINPTLYSTTEVWSDLFTAYQDGDPAQCALRNLFVSVCHKTLIIRLKSKIFEF